MFGQEPVEAEQRSGEMDVGLDGRKHLRLEQQLLEV
jgi:hypothetical protein